MARQQSSNTFLLSLHKMSSITLQVNGYRTSEITTFSFSGGLGPQHAFIATLYGMLFSRPVRVSYANISPLYRKNRFHFLSLNSHVGTSYKSVGIKWPRKKRHQIMSISAYGEACVGPENDESIKWQKRLIWQISTIHILIPSILKIVN